MPIRRTAGAASLLALALAGGVLSPSSADAVVPGCDVARADGPQLAFAGRYSAPASQTGETVAEIVAYEDGLLYVLNTGAVDVVDMRDPANPVKVGLLSVPGEPTSVAVNNGLVAVSVPAADKTRAGAVHLFRNGTRVGRVMVGAGPDMVTFTPDGTRLVVANEGEPSGYGVGHVDPDGSLSVIAVRPFRGPVQGNPQPVATIAFTDFNVGGPRSAELPADVRISGPGASVAQDLEPEYVTVAPDGRTAWVSLQENNALAQIDLRDKTVTRIVALGYADHSLAGHRIDVSDQDGATPEAPSNLRSWPVKGIYMPDGIAHLAVDGRDYVLTANEGDAREVPGHTDIARAKAAADPVAFPDSTSNSKLGRLNVTTAAPAARNAAGKLTSLFSYGTRSFSIRAADGSLVWDSGDAFECLTAELVPSLFNVSNSNNTLDSRSDDKGPEPESVVVGTVGDRMLAFVGLERVGGVMVYDVTEPTAPRFVQYFTTRVPGETVGPDSGPEGMAFVPAERSTTGRPQLLVGHEVSGTVAILSY